MNKIESLSVFLLFQFLCGCGVKGVPQAPLTAPVLGRGEANYSKATENLKIKKNHPRNNDWDDSNDFSEEKEK